MGLHPAWVTPGSVLAVIINWREAYIDLTRSPLNKYVARMTAEASV
jgi:hypothetical protein